MITSEDYLWFVDRSLDQIVAVLRDLGDDKATETLGIPGTNSAYGIATHCVGVMRAWGGFLVAGRTVVRHRETEFVATGTVDDLVAELASARRELGNDVATARFDEPLRNSASPTDALLPLGRSQGAALLHLYEELAQHLGQLQITRDVLLAEA